MKDKIYPAIYSTLLKSTYLYSDKDNYCSLSFPTSGSWLKASDLDDVDSDINITQEYLQNTYGEVVSPEHAEFIIELCANNEIKTKAYRYSAMSFFMIAEGELYFYSDEIMPIRNKCKQITIPLPPNPEPLKNAGDNLILGCEDSKCDEWPQVGSIVNLKGDKYNDGACEVVKIKVNSSGVKMALLCRLSDDHPLWSPVSNLTKPKSPEEELRDDLMDMATTAMSNKDFDLEHNCYYLVSGLMKKYNIKPQ